jgi:hypothetical protein
MSASPQAIQTPLPLVQKPPAYVSFSAEVNITTAEQLQGVAANVVAQGHPELHLLLSTPGGAVQYGIIPPSATTTPNLAAGCKIYRFSLTE